jgi:hypothetical protein
MSRGPGRWERELISATASICITPVSGLVKAAVPEPDRSDFTSARRAAKSLAMKSQVAALYAWSCPRCFRIQDRADPQACCARPRAMLAVARPERRHLLAHPAPPPGGQAPAWLNDARPAPAGLLAPTLDDVASLAVRRLWERLESGVCSVSPADVAALVRLAREIKTEPDAGRSDERWQAAVREILWLARSHLRDGWPAFAADVRASAGLAAMWGPPPHKRAGDGKSR